MLTALMLFTISIDHNKSGNAVNVDLLGMKVLAIDEELPPEGPDCTTFGFREWDSKNPLRSNGYDCLCQARSRVKTDCI
jgi:hypothetical protein